MRILRLFSKGFNRRVRLWFRHWAMLVCVQEHNNLRYDLETFEMKSSSEVQQLDNRLLDEETNRAAAVRTSSRETHRPTHDTA